MKAARETARQAAPKVAYVLPTLVSPSGWRTLVLGALRRLRLHVNPVLFVDRESLEEARRSLPGIPVCALPGTQTPNLTSWQGLRKLSATYLALRRMPPADFDLVHSFETYPAGLVGHWLAQKNGCPHVMTAVGTYSIWWYGYSVDRDVYSRVLRSAALICPISPQTGHLLQRYFGDALKGVELRSILMGNDFAARVPRSIAVDRPVPQVQTLLSVGDVKARKGHHISLAAFARLKPEFPDLRYHVVGSYQQNVYFQLLQEYVREHRLTGVEFLGQVSEEVLRREYQNASVFVLTPQQDGLRFEGFGLVYLEAGAYGLPVVASRSGGVPAAVRDGETGLLAAEGDVEGVADNIRRLLKDPGLSRRLGEENRRWAEQLTWERYAAEQVEAYQAVLESR